MATLSQPDAVTALRAETANSLTQLRDDFMVETNAIKEELKATAKSDRIAQAISEIVGARIKPLGAAVFEIQRGFGSPTLFTRRFYHR